MITSNNRKELSKIKKGNGLNTDWNQIGKMIKKKEISTIG